MVRDGEGRELWRSPSSITLDMLPDQTQQHHMNLQPGEDRFARMDSEDVFYLAYKVLWLGKE